ncbi:MAG: putative sulfate/molybdate transporter [Pseudomonadota bacterium]
MQKRIIFNRDEFAGAFGDLGTDLPLVIGLILACDLNPFQTFLIYGILQMLSGFLYGLPMPVQPLKAIAAIMIAQKLPAYHLFSAGLALALMMFLLTITGLAPWLAKKIPKAVVRGIQAGLGITLLMIATRKYIPSGGQAGIGLALGALFLVMLLRKRKAIPMALIVLPVGFIYAFFVDVEPSTALGVARAHLAFLSPFQLIDLKTTLLTLALPQLCLSLSNSVIATAQVAKDYFPEHPVSVRKIGLTYSLFNFISAFMNGIPVCHGSGGMVGHYVFGARSGGSVFIYGLFYLALAFFCGHLWALKYFPLPILGIMLAWEAANLIFLSKDLFPDQRQVVVAGVVALVAAFVPYGFFIGLILGVALYWMIIPKQMRFR